MGAAMQAQAHFQVVRRVVDDGLDPQAALDAARFRALGGRRVELEPGPGRARPTACARAATTFASPTCRTASAWAR